MNDTEAAVEVLRRCEDDLAYYCEAALKIKGKDGKLVPLRLNRGQRELDRRLSEQLKAIGRVRALILKGRQMGISTYLQARGRWLVKKYPGRNMMTIAHEQEASDNLFDMAFLYHEHEPEFLRPATGASNAKKLWFSDIDSSMQVATAGSKDTGRSKTIQVLHGSEHAFWPNAEGHSAGIGQTVPDATGTEVWLESTANGVVENDFYDRWRKAINGDSEYIAIFLPWFWDAGYRRPVAGLKRTQEEEELAEVYGLDDEQLAFRRNKIESDFKGDASRFVQEYPNNWAEAFVAADRDTLIAPRLVVRAQAAQQVESVGPLVAACDPARYGDDATAIVVRQGRKVRFGKRYYKKSTMEVAGIIARFVEQYKPAALFLDTIGLGAGVYDRLAELGYCEQDDAERNVVIAVNFANSATDDEHYVNKRAECWDGVKKWLEAFPCSLPEGNEWMADLTAPGYTYDSSGRLRIESKERMRKDGKKSPDLGDALAMTFAEPVRERVKSAPALRRQEVFDEVVGW